MSLIDKLIKEEQIRKKRKRNLFFSFIIILIVIFNLRECENKSANNKATLKPKKSELKNSNNLDFKDIDSGKFQDEDLKLKSYKILIVSQLKEEIESRVKFEKCNIESDISWLFRWYPKTGEIENSSFSSERGEIKENLKNCLQNEVSNLKIEIKNKLEIPYISLDLKIK